MGMGEFDPGSKKFVWDKDYTDRMKMCENELNRLAAIEETQRRIRELDIAMKEGEDFMKKKKWQDALTPNRALDEFPIPAIEMRDKVSNKLERSLPRKLKSKLKKR